MKKGEKIKRLALLECVSNVPEGLHEILNRSIRGGKNEVSREGFPQWHPVEFVTMFCEANRCETRQVVNRIEFKYVEVKS